jgi:hypothetical protein
MSPFLFLLVVKGLSREIKETKREETIKGIKIGRYLTLSHLLFVDYVILFCLGTMEEAEKLHGDPRTILQSNMDGSKYQQIKYYLQ